MSATISTRSARARHDVCSSRCSSARSMFCHEAGLSTNSAVPGSTRRSSARASSPVAAPREQRRLVGDLQARCHERDAQRRIGLAEAVRPPGIEQHAVAVADAPGLLAVVDRVAVGVAGEVVDRPVEQAGAALQPGRRRDGEVAGRVLVEQQRRAARRLAARGVDPGLGTEPVRGRERLRRERVRGASTRRRPCARARRSVVAVTSWRTPGAARASASPQRRDLRRAGRAAARRRRRSTGRAPGRLARRRWAALADAAGEPPQRRVGLVALERVGAAGRRPHRLRRRCRRRCRSGRGRPCRRGRARRGPRRRRRGHPRRGTRCAARARRGSVTSATRRL